MKSIMLGARRRDPFVFHSFFEMGLDESASPFLNKRGREISKNISFKAALCAALLLVASLFVEGHLSSIILSSVYLIVGIPFLINAIEDIFFHRDINIDVLMTLAAFSSYFLNAAFEGGLLLVLFALSGSLESLVTLRAKKALSLVHHLAPQKALLITGEGEYQERAVEDVPVGATLFVRTGELVPLDSVIVEGLALLSFAHVTGESVPVGKQKGDEVVAGARVLEGNLVIKVTHKSAESQVAKIISLITEAQHRKPKIERWFDQFGRYYAMSIIAISVCATLFFTLVMHLPLLGSSGALYRSLAFLITASPCALILAVPTAYLSALAIAAKKGIVLKGGFVFDAIEKCSLVAFDKTGTLTEGSFQLAHIEKVTESNWTEEEILSMAASLERYAVHPFAKALLDEAEGLPLYSAKSVEVIPGQGVEGFLQYQGKGLEAYIGTPDGRELTVEAKGLLEKRRHTGKIVGLFEVGEAKVFISFEDKPREYIKQMTEGLFQRGKKMVMLTGDHRKNAEKVAREVGIFEVYADLKPEDKLQKIEELSKKEGLLMCGDGINDAPALSRATVGVSMGTIASGAAKEVADCIFLHDHIEELQWLFDKAAMTKKIVRQNLCIALIAMVGGSLPAIMGFIPLWLAVILHEGGTVLVGLNAMRLLRQ